MLENTVGCRLNHRSLCKHFKVLQSLDNKATKSLHEKYCSSSKKFVCFTVFISYKINQSSKNILVSYALNSDLNWNRILLKLNILYTITDYKLLHKYVTISNK